MKEVLDHAGWLVSRMGRGAVQKTLNAIAIAFVSVCIPWVIGSRFLSPFILIPLACLSVFLVSDLMVASFAADSREVAAKAIACILVGWSFGLTILVLGVIGLNIQMRTGRWLLPSGEILVDALGLSLAGCVLGAGVTWQVAGRFGAGVARLVMKLAIVVVTLLSIYGCNRWQIEGTFLLTTRVITWLTGFAGAGMLATGVGLLALPKGSARK